MGQPRLITARLNRIQCGRWGWLQGPAFSCVIPTERKMQGRTLYVCVCVCALKSASMGEKAYKDERDFRASLAKPAPLTAD